MYSFALRQGTLEDSEEVHTLVREAADWLRTSKDTDQWAEPWPDRTGHRDRIRTDLNKGKTWLLWDGPTVAGTITIDTEEPVDTDERPVWPAHKSPEPAIYVRRVIVGRRYSGIGLGAAMLDWAAEAATKEYQATLVRIDVWTTNRRLHEYYERQLFARREARDPVELPDYPAQALFERLAIAPQAVPKTDYRNFFRVEPGEHSRCRLLRLNTPLAAELYEIDTTRQLALSTSGHYSDPDNRLIILHLGSSPVLGRSACRTISSGRLLTLPPSCRRAGSMTSTRSCPKLYLMISRVLPSCHGKPRM